jgi:sporulation protein YlmC with PRC-barrel domain
MAHYGTLGTYQFDSNAEDVRGSSVYNADDDKLGKIDDVIFDHSSGSIDYIVVDTGGWLSSKKFLVPADSLRPSAKHEGEYQVDLNRTQIESFPQYNESDLKDDKKWGDYQNKYRSKWSSDTVMHREGTDRNITPTTAQMTQGSGATGPANWERKEAQTPTASRHSATLQGSAEGGTHFERTIPATGNEVTIQSSAAGIGDRWSTFESRLRQRRHDITHSCETCSIGPASESASDERKAV